MLPITQAETRKLHVQCIYDALGKHARDPYLQNDYLDVVLITPCPLYIVCISMDR